MQTMTKLLFGLGFAFCGLGALSLHAQSNPYAIPQRGIVPTGSYDVSKIDTVDAVSGNVSLHIPLTALPPNRAGFGTAVDLYYNALSYQVNTEMIGGFNITTIQESSHIDPFDTGGWRYGFQYSFLADSIPVDDNCSMSAEKWYLRYRIVLPDGSSHTLYVNGRHDDFQGYYGYADNSLCLPPPISGSMSLYAADDTYLRMAWNATTGVWTLYFPDGRSVQGSGATVSAGGRFMTMAGNETDLYDRNGNHVYIGEVTVSGTLTRTLVDDIGRSISVSHPATGNDTISQAGYLNQPLSWQVSWVDDEQDSSHTYDCGASAPCPAPGVGFVVAGVSLPNSLAYQFCYDGAITQPSGCPNSHPAQWGQLSYMILPTEALPVQAHVQYTYPTSPFLGSSGSVFPVSNKKLTWTDENNGGAVNNETTTYVYAGLSSTFTNPDGSVVTHYFYDPAPPNPFPFTGLVYKTWNQTTGDILEQVWSTNVPYGTAVNPYGYFQMPGNPYVQTELRTPGGTPAQTAAKVYTYDRNGNQTTILEYDWFPHANVTYNGNFATGFTGGTTPLRTTTNTFVNGAGPALGDISGTNTTGAGSSDSLGYWNTLSPQLLRLVCQSIVAGSPGATTQYAYDGGTAPKCSGSSALGTLTSGNLTQQLNWNSTTSSYLATNHTYDAWGKLSSTHNPLNYKTSYTYDPNNLYPTAIVQYQADGTTPARTFNFAWDFYTGLKTSDTDVDHSLTRNFDYDQYGRNTSIREGTTRHTAITYSDTARTVTVNRDLFTYNETPGGLQDITWYDQLGRVRKTQDPAGNLVQTRYYIAPNGLASYELVSNPYVTTTETTMGWTATTMDVVGRPVRVEHFSGAAVPAPWGTSTSTTGAATTMYNANCSTNADEASVSRVACMDGLGRLGQVTESGISTTTIYGYDVLDDLISVTQPGSAGRTFVYNSLKQLTSATNPESGTTGYTYDANGNLFTRTDARGVVTTNLYNEIDLITSKTYSDGTPSVGYTYDHSWLSQVSAASTYHYTPDQIGRPMGGTQTTNSIGYSFALNNYPFIGVKDITYPGSNRKFTTGYDSFGRATTLSGQIGTNPVKNYVSATGSFATTGAWTSRTLGNGLTETESYNSRLQPLQIQLGSLLTLGYTYSPTQNNGNLASQTITRAGNTWLDVYGYDGVNRLMAPSESGAGSWSQNFCYDTRGNRWVTTTSGLPAMTAETPQGSNCLSTSSPYASNNRVTGWIYDLAGNLTGIPSSAGTLVRVACDSSLPSGGMLRAVCYDGENRMTSSTTSLGLTSTYTYDGEGRRVQKVTSSGTTVYVYDPLGNLAQEYGVASDTGTTYLTTDALGSTRLVTTQTGALNKSFDYLPFGEEIRATYAGRDSTFPASPYPTSPPTGTSLKFTSKERDAETGLDFFGARYMSSAQGRFTSPDTPLTFADPENPQSWNLYSYGLNNPLRYTDPDGHDVVPCSSNDPDHPDICYEHTDPAPKVRPQTPPADVQLDSPLFFAVALGTQRAGRDISTSAILIGGFATAVASTYAIPAVVGGLAAVGEVGAVGANLLPPKARQILGTLVPLAGKTVAKAITERGGGAQQVRQVATNLQQMTLGEVAKLAAYGEGAEAAAAKTAIHVVKNAAAQAEKYQK